MSKSHCTDTAFTVIWVRSTKHKAVVWKSLLGGVGGAGEGAGWRKSSL